MDTVENMEAAMDMPGVAREESIDRGIPWWIALVVGLVSLGGLGSIAY